MIVPSPYARQLRRLPVAERTATADGAVTRYWEYGDPDAPTTIVLVHGFRGDHHGLEPLVAQLGDARLILPDLPGFGATGALDREHDVAAYAGWLAGFLTALSLEEGRYTLLGHSFGTIVVAAALAGVAGDDFPRPASVALLNPIAENALRGPNAAGTRLAVLYYRLGAALPEAAGFALLRNPGIVRAMSMAMAKSRDRRLRRWIHDQHDRYFSDFADRRVVLEAFRASVSTDVAAFASRIPEPTLLVAADRDDLSTPAQQHRLARLFPDARLHVLRGVGHLVHYEAPEAAAALVRALAEGKGR